MCWLTDRRLSMEMMEEITVSSSSDPESNDGDDVEQEGQDLIVIDETGSEDEIEMNASCSPSPKPAPDIEEIIIDDNNYDEAKPPQNEGIPMIKSDELETVENEELENEEIETVENEELENEEIETVENEDVENDEIETVENEDVENDEIEAVDNEEFETVENIELENAENEIETVDNEEIETVENEEFENEEIETVDNDTSETAANVQVINVENEETETIDNAEVETVDDGEVQTVENYEYQTEPFDECKCENCGYKKQLECLQREVAILKCKLELLESQGTCNATDRVTVPKPVQRRLVKEQLDGTRQVSSKTVRRMQSRMKRRAIEHLNAATKCKQATGSAIERNPVTPGKDVQEENMSKIVADYVGDTLPTAIVHLGVPANQEVCSSVNACHLTNTAESNGAEECVTSPS